MTTVRRKDRGRLKRKRIVNAARICFAEFGFQATNIDMIAERAEMSVGAIYCIHHTKAALIEDFVRREVARWLICARILIREVSKASPCVHSVSVGYVMPDWQELRLYSEAMAEAARNPEVTRIVTCCDRRLRSAFVKAFMACAGDTVQVPSQNPVLVDVMLVLIDGLLLRATYCNVSIPEVIADGFQLIRGMIRDVSGHLSTGTTQRMTIASRPDRWGFLDMP